MTDSTLVRSLQACGALDRYRDAFTSIASALVGVEVLPLARHYNVRVAADAVGGTLLVALLGSALPTMASTWIETSVGTVIWLGPDEWLVVEGIGQVGLEGRLRNAVIENDGAVVEQSGQRVSFLVTGDAAGLLTKGTSIDLHPAAFPAGTAVQSFLGQTIVVLLARNDSATEIEILVRSSFARYLADWLLDAASDPLATP
ncbi:sarcosine oxidase subunit gamma [Cryobacterium psychrophilum]|uniref:Sarcosine oxidase subunit gamma n=1 Tax=Cryobacterium psychrophilum TaxID=41988 RepID=A0A4Y8KQK3_9MICO|nr:sarcosine oxidase subunit gamma family protein [Cryobacterium psychrophilum]TDW29447.1 heterotetrameric sarcosine oxidase gamma subunit [Cryobacterium psychrophilum]TFD81415.1 sarcosine oxidase subunit gamma [Cryobacterium psychrophilum]